MTNPKRSSGAFMGLAYRRNAICLNGVGHDGDSPNTDSSDAANSNCPCKPDDLVADQDESPNNPQVGRVAEMKNAP
jgi:hypothetical protein